MKTVRATIKERSGAVLHPEYLVPDDELRFYTRQYFIDFWGLNDPDVVEWELEGI